jgi:hypothetical protein
MTVRATDFALGDLVSKGFEGASVSGKVDDVAPLLADVVELEHEQVSTAAIHAFRPQEHLVDMEHVPTLSSGEAGAGFQARWVGPP